MSVQDDKPVSQPTDYPPWLIWWFAAGVIVAAISCVAYPLAVFFGPYWTQLFTSGGFSIGTGSIALSLLKGENEHGR